MASPSTESPASASGLPHNIKVLGLASLLNDIASEMIFPLLPIFVTTVLGGTTFAVGVIEGVADSVASFLKLWSGGRSDQAGRRKGFVVFGYSIAAVVRPIVSFVIAPWQLLVIRTADRIGKGVRSAPRDALIADSTDGSNRGRAFGFDRAMDHVGAAVGPLLAAGFLWLWPGELRTLFLLSIVPGALVLLLLLFGLREVAATEPPKEKVTLTLAPFGRNFRLLLVALFIFTLGNSSDAFLLIRARELGVPTFALPLLWCVFHVYKSIGNLFLGRAVDRYGARPFLFLGWLFYAAIYLAFALATSVWEAWLFFLAYALYYALTEPAEKTLVAQLAGRERKGLAFGWYNFALGVGTLPASLIFGALYERFGAVIAFGFGAALALAAALLILLVRPVAAAE
jgi:MFS family permease